MHIYAQHGYGKADMVEVGAREGYISGVVLSPRNEEPDKMINYVVGLRSEFGDKLSVLFDPQFYATAISPAREGCLPKYAYYQPGLTRGVSPADIRKFADEALVYQARMGVTRILSPSVIFSDFSDPWSQIALSFAQESMEVHAGLETAPPLLLSFVFHESALRARPALDEFLDIVSLWDVQGFYVVVCRSDTKYPAAFEEHTMKNLMYLVYVLAEISHHEVVCGYSDLEGLLLHAVGATATATGWFQALRQFSSGWFRPPGIARPSRKRYTSAPLLNSVLLVPELQTIHALGRISSVASNTLYDETLRLRGPAEAAWPRRTECLHHWAVLAGLARQVSSQGSVARNLAVLEESVQKALKLYHLLGQTVPFETPSGRGNLHKWLEAIRLFRTDVRTLL